MIAIRTRFQILAPFVVVTLFACGGTTTGENPDGGPLTDSGGGGSTGTGGGSGTGGQLGDGSTSCSGTVTLRLRPPNDATQYCVGLRCKTTWLVIESPLGSFPIEPTCSASCDDCRAVSCPAICPAPRPLPAEGEPMTWDGAYWKNDLCGGDMGCTRRQCA